MKYISIKITLNFMLNSIYELHLILFLLKCNISFYYDYKYKSSLLLAVLVTLSLESQVIFNHITVC